MRPKDPIAIHDAPDRCPDQPLIVGGVVKESLWTRWMAWYSEMMGPGTVLLAGDRAEESNTRYFMVTRGTALAGAKWSSLHGGTGAPTCYPIYDWTVEDVWAFLSQNGVAYNRFYDNYFRIGVPPLKQRAGYLMSRASYKRMADIQEFEPETYDRLVARTEGLARIAARYAREDTMFSGADALPSAFLTWGGYRDFLLGELEDDQRLLFETRFARSADTDGVHKLQVKQLVSGDLEGFKSLRDPAVARAKSGKVGGRLAELYEML